MNWKKFLSSSFLTLLAAGLVCTVATGCKQNTISTGQQALDTWAVQNLMSEHEYYHAAGMNLEEVDALWVSPTGENAKTACFFSPGWVMQGVATVRKNYGEGHASDKAKAFEELKKAYPELASMDAKTSDIGGEFAMHTSTTPVIEVAADGKTAKGIWYSPGLGLTPHVNGDAVQVGSIFFWEKYAGDFVKENGQWKIWHLGMYYDFTPSFPDTMTERLNKGTAPKAQAGGPGGLPAAALLRRAARPALLRKVDPVADRAAPQSNKEKGETMTAEQIAAGGMLPNPYKYPSWSPDRKSVITPKFPEPYNTFSETFSYGPYDSNNQYKDPWNK